MTLAPSDTLGLTGTVRAVSSGTTATIPYGRRTMESAIIKTALPGRVPLTTLGIPGDEHVYHDHGGPDMALLAYPYEHYAHWREVGLDLPDHGAFGENLTVTGLLEDDVHLGDVFAIGSATVQICQPRSPCYKLAARFGRKDLAVLFQDTGYIGYLIRVLTEGDIGAGDQMRLVERADHGITIAEAGRVLNTDRNDLEAARRVVAVDALGSSVRRALEQRLRTAGDVGLDTVRLFDEPSES
jgi:MOSC domain-containing protein YiiM